MRYLKRTADKIFGTVTDEFYWRFYHWYKPKWAEDYFSPESLNHPHRNLLIDEISGFAPFSSVLEIGCASGPNLFLLSKKFPGVKLHGVDINKKAIRAGREWFKKNKIRNIELFCQKPYRLRQFKDKGVDVVFTNATLIYVGPDKINGVVGEIARIARKGCVFFEWQSDNPEPQYDDHWIYNYAAMLKKFSPQKIEIKRTPSGVWDKEWEKYGRFIIATFNNRGVVL